MKTTCLHSALAVLGLAITTQAAEPVMCGKPASADAFSVNGLPATSGKSAVQRTAEEMVAQLPPERQSDLLILLNEASEDRLLAIAGIAKTRATAIVLARPISSLSDLVGVKGIGVSTLSRILAHDPHAAGQTSAEAEDGGVSASKS